MAGRYLLHSAQIHRIFCGAEDANEPRLCGLNIFLNIFLLSLITTTTNQVSCCFFKKKNRISVTSAVTNRENAAMTLVVSMSCNYIVSCYSKDKYVHYKKVIFRRFFARGRYRKP
jgi:hypothetical protein